MSEIVKTLQAIEDKVSKIEKSTTIMETDLKHFCSKQKDHENRLRKMEQYLPLLALIAGGIGAAIMGWFSKMV